MGSSSDQKQGPQLAGPTPFAQTLLDLFSPVRPGGAFDVETGSPEQRALWAADALHRANNLTQMALSLGSTGLRHLHGPYPDDHGAQARALSRAYAELATVEPSDRPLPCAALLEAIATRLVTIFGETRSIQVAIMLDDIALQADQRRALTLIASELVINALKYAFPGDATGTISLSLKRRMCGIELSVADDGQGLVSSPAGGGTGTALVRRLAILLGANIQRLSATNGLRVIVTIPDLKSLHQS